MMTLKEKANNIITFHNGLPGLESLKTFVLEDLEGSEPFKMLKSTADENIGFVTIVPFDFKKDYEVNLTDAVINSLHVESSEDVLILNTVTLNSDVKKITTNLKAPIIVNVKNNLGYQMILDRENYSIKHPLMKE
jgi:flagellar assembly factor FliW